MERKESSESISDNSNGLFYQLVNGRGRERKSKEMKRKRERVIRRKRAGERER